MSCAITVEKEEAPSYLCTICVKTDHHQCEHHGLNRCELIFRVKKKSSFYIPQQLDIKDVIIFTSFRSGFATQTEAEQEDLDIYLSKTHFYKLICTTLITNWCS